jgi:hypothetical protein
MNDLFQNACSGSPVYAEKITKFLDLSNEFYLQQRSYPADKEILGLRCRNHEFYVVSAEERDEVKSTCRDLDSESGRMTASFLQGLLNT